MSEHGWRDLIVGDRMRVDEAFAGAVQRSGFTRSEWGMIMTAVEFEIEGVGESARLVADTSNVDVILPQLEDIVERTGGRPPKSSRGALSGLLSSGGSGLLDSVRSSLGISNGVDPERRQEAVRLANDYAERLQGHLEERGRWEQIRDLAAEQDDPASAP